MNDRARLFAPVNLYNTDPIFEPLRGCQLCKLSPRHNDQAIQVVMPVGNRNAKMAIMFEGPGANEAETGYTVVGWSYQLVEWLTKLGLNELTDYLRFNSVLCRPPNNREPTGTELNICSRNTDYILRSMPNLKLLVLCGSIALRQIEGSDALLSLRMGNLGRISGKFGKEEIYTLALRHPAYLAYIENKQGYEKAVLQYINQLEFLKKIYNNIDKLNFNIPYNYNFVEDKDQIIELIRELRTKETISIDVETGSIRRGWANIVTCSFSHRPYESFCIPFRQIVKANKSKTVSTKKGNKSYVIDFEIIPYHDDKFFSYMVEELKLLLEEHGQQRPNLLAWNSGFEQMCFENDLGIQLVPTEYQIRTAGDLDRCVSFDLMKQFRLAITDINSLSLKSILSYCLPLEAGDKDVIVEALSENDIIESGFAKMAVKNTVDINLVKELGKRYDEWQRQLEEEKTNRKRIGNKSVARLPKCPLNKQELEVVEQFYCSTSGLTRYETLVDRNNRDSDWELRLQENCREMLKSNDKLTIKSKFINDEIWI